MTVGAAVLGFAVLAAVLTVTPGLDTTLVLRAALTRHRREAYATAAGIVAGLLVWGVAAAVGISALLATSAVAFDALRYVGAAYLVGYGVRLLTGAVGRRSAAAEPADEVPGPAGRAVRAGLLTNLLNPKVGVFYVALLPQFLPVGSDPLLVGLVLAAVHGAMSLAWFAVLILLADALGRWVRRPRTMRAIDGLTGAVLVGFGIRLALADR